MSFLSHIFLSVVLIVQGFFGHTQSTPVTTAPSTTAGIVFNNSQSSTTTEAPAVPSGTTVNSSVSAPAHTTASAVSVPTPVKTSITPPAQTTFQPTPPTSSANQTQDLSVAAVNKSNAIAILNAIIFDYTKLNIVQNIDMNSMTGIENSLAGNTSQTALSFLNLTNIRIPRVQNQITPTKGLIAQAQSDLSNLQSEPLSYFINYQTPQDTYSALNSFPTVASNYLSDFNMYSNLLAQASTLPNPQSSTCTLQNIGNEMYSIVCN